MTQDRKSFEEECARADLFQEQVVKFYLSNADRDDAEELTRARFNIDQFTLDFILEADFVNSMMS